MISEIEDEESAWQFMKWYVGAECQSEYANEMVAIIGDSAKHPTANRVALETMPWTQSEYEEVAKQFENLAAIPNYPGSYFIGRHANFAFLAALNEDADPTTEILSYINTINKEITRKREEFGLETLDYIGQTLAQKRMTQAISELEAAKESSSYAAAYDVVVERALEVMNGGKTEDYASVESAAIDLREANAELFGKAADFMVSASKSLIEYEKYK